MIRNENNEILKKCAMCKEEFATKFPTRAYCDTCNAEYHKEYNKNKDKGYYLYIVLDNDRVLYVGATEDIKYRIEQQHLKGHSHLHDLMMSDDWTCIKYLNITKLVNNREEMLLLENSLIELYNTDYNHKKSIIRNVDKHREFELLSEIHSFDKFWITYCENEHKKNAFIS